MFAPISGTHFNPAVSLVAMIDRSLSIKEFIAYD
jgi:glycerol uptake facilitator-like aquaporin